MKKRFALLLAAAMAFSLLAGCGPKTPASSQGSASSAPAASSQPAGDESEPGDVSEPAPGPAAEYELPDLMVMSGPTGVGAAYLMMQNEDTSSTVASVASATVVTDNSEVMNALINGDADIAAVATNVAANLVNKTDGGIQVLAINTLGVLYILEKGDTVHTMSDLRGKTLYAPSTAKGANPEYILNYLLEQNDVDPSQVNMEWMTPQEITAKMASSEEGICMLPVPAATALLLKDSGVREAISLSDEWDKLGRGSLPQGCIVARTQFVEENPEAVESFLLSYEASILYMNDEANRAEAAKMVAALGIAASEGVAAKAIPQCNLSYITGEEMKDMLEQYYRVLFQADPAAIGGAMPYDSFYYGVS